MPPAPWAQHPDTATILFVADLHLDPSRPAMIQAFERFCVAPARAADAVYILGDLFDAWIGDDDMPAWPGVVAALRGLSSAGVPVAFMPGNRDFLVGEALLEATAMQRLDEPSVIELGGRRTLLCHGDTLCTDDQAYQAFRLQVRDPAWQQEMLARPLSERRGLADSLRNDSGTATAAKGGDEMDVNAEATCALCRNHDAERLIHGHTHRPGHDIWRVGNHDVERWVLADWFRAPSMLRARAGSIEAVTDLD